MERRNYLFSGQVQGVGFRYTARGIALRHAVTGYVKNLPDGRVEMVIEGEISELNKVGKALAEQMGGFIRDTKVNSGPAMGEFQGFDIRH